MIAVDYELIKLLEDELGKEKAEKVVKIIDKALENLETRVQEQKPILKAEIKEELLRELATKYDIQIIKLEIENTKKEVQQEINIHRKETENIKIELEKKIEKIEIYLKVLIGLAILGFTIFNPGFLEIIKSIVK